ncbi:hypothetical protein HMPREF1869_00119 [Bacteroidales bacterium KA00251]|nr:hypothetical protein HMPREF1869_00119 [Bacteroidales bacterium KA00251]
MFLFFLPFILSKFGFFNSYRVLNNATKIVYFFESALFCPKSLLRSFPF